MSGLVNLRAVDAEDMTLISACLQDALVPLDDIVYLPEDGQLVMVANRFRWEKLDRQSDSGPFERVHAGVRFDNVTKVSYRGIDRRRAGQVLVLLTIRAASDIVELCFSGEAAIRLEVSGIRCLLKDLGTAWTTKMKPRHAVFGED